jgi:DNA-binding winged helix-turn-helix (wHTH) protein
LKRAGLAPRYQMPAGEDRLGDLYDLVAQKDPEALRTVLEQGLYYYLHAYFDLRHQQRALIFDLLPRGLLVLDHGNVQVVERGLSRVLRRILEALAVSHQSKAELVEKVWGYEYDASRHDPLVYTSISKIRQLLGDAGTWIEADEKGYRLRSGVRLQNQQGLAAPREEDKSRVNIMNAPANARLSFRQLRILAAFDNDSKQAVAVDDVMRDFDVSRATATRDLGTLTEEGFLRRMGRARATRYARTPKGIRG